MIVRFKCLGFRVYGFMGYIKYSCFEIGQFHIRSAEGGPYFLKEILSCAPEAQSQLSLPFRVVVRGPT